MKHLAAVAIVVAVAAMAGSAAAQEVLNFYGFRFEDRLGFLKRVGVTDFEKDRAGFGYGIRYAATGHRVDIFVYDRGLKKISPNTQSDEQKAEFALAIREIQIARASGIYTDVKEGEKFEAGATKDAFFVCQRFRLTLKSSEEADSVLCLGARNDKFIKVRITLLPPPAAPAGIVEGIMKQIGEMAGF